ILKYLHYTWVECTKNPFGRQSCVTVGHTGNNSKRAGYESNCFQEKDEIIEELKMEIKFQKDINKSLSMQTTVLTDVRKLLLNFNSQQLTPLIQRPTRHLVWKTGKRLEMSLANYTDSAPLTSTVIEDEDDGYLHTITTLFRYLTLYCVG
ncbi:Uncharacterized protein APZ42_007797, partial [Daphnia magna]